MQRVSIDKVTGKRIGSQSGGDELHPHQIQGVITVAFNEKYKDAKDKPQKSSEEFAVEFAPELAIAREKYRQTSLDVERQNAINAGYKEEDIEVKFVTDEENEALAVALIPEPTEEQIYEEAIKTKEKEILRNMAIAELSVEPILK